MNTAKKLLAVLVILFGSLFFAQGKSRILSATSDNNGYYQYKMNEWTIVLNGQWASDPYNQEQIALDMYFTGPDGKTRVLPCFYVSGASGKKSIWKARFAPLSLGDKRIHRQLEWE